MHAEGSPAGCTEVTRGTEAGSAGGGHGADSAGDGAPHAGLLDGNTREERAQGAAQLSQEGQGVYLSPAAQ